MRSYIKKFHFQNRFDYFLSYATSLSTWIVFGRGLPPPAERGRSFGPNLEADGGWSTEGRRLGGRDPSSFSCSCRRTKMWQGPWYVYNKNNSYTVLNVITLEQSRGPSWYNLKIFQKCNKGICTFLCLYCSSISSRLFLSSSFFLSASAFLASSSSRRRLDSSSRFARPSSTCVVIKFVRYLYYFLG